MNNSQLFITAHELAKTYEGDYRACFALALKNLRKDKIEALASGAIRSKNQITAFFKIQYAQTKERQWLKEAGAKWNPEIQRWVLKTKECQVAQSSNFGFHVIPSHLTSLNYNLA